jgi:hypothetical protein
MGSLSTQEYLAPVKAAPELNLPTGSSVRVSIINTTTDIQGPTAHFMKPEIKGHEFLRAPAYSFLIEHPPSGRKFVFDMGVRKDWNNFAPAILRIL